MPDETTATVEETKEPEAEAPNEFAVLDDAVADAPQDAFVDPEPAGEDKEQPADETAEASDEAVGDEVAEAPETKVSEDPFDNVGGHVLLDTAKRVYGFTDAEARSFRSPEALAAVLSREIDMAMPAGGTAEPEVKPEDQPYKVDLNPEEIDASVINELERLNEHFEKKFDRQSKQQAEDRVAYQRVAESANAAQVQRTRQEFGEWTKTLGDQWKDHYGNGSLADIKANSPAAKNVQALVVRADAISSSYDAVGQPISDTEALNLSHYLLNRETIDSENKSSVRTDMLKSIKTGPRTIAHKPTHRAEPSDETTDQRAAREYDQARAAFDGGAHTPETDDDELSRILVD